MPFSFHALRSGRTSPSDLPGTAWAPFLAIAILLFFSAGQMYRHTLTLLAIIGLVELVRTPRRTHDPRLWWYAAAFLCLWIPALLSMFDAESLSRTVPSVLRFLVYLFAGYFLIRRLDPRSHADFILAGAFVIMLVWVADAVLQLAVGHDLFGNTPLPSGRLTGMLPGASLGFVLSILSPLFFHAVYRFGKRIPLLWLVLFPYLIVLLYSGTRVAWMLLAVGTFLHAILLHLEGVRLDRRKAVIGLVIVVLMSGVALTQSDWLRARFTQLSGLFSGDYSEVNTAVSNRLPHWTAAINMWEQNPINGVGVRSYPVAYPHYSDGDTTHRGQPHFFLLEVAAETGTIGLVGYLLFYLVILAALWKLVKEKRYEAIPWGLTLMVAAFPLSASRSIYSHFVSALIWYIAIVFFALSAARPESAESPVESTSRAT